MALILIVEDSQQMAQAARTVLESAGHTTIVTLAVGEALSKCQERKPDLVLTECYIAESTAVDFLEALNRVERPPPVIVATGCGNENIAAEVAKKGALAYIVKTGLYLNNLPTLVNWALAHIALKNTASEQKRNQRRLAAQNEMAEWLAHNFKNILAASVGAINLINLNDPNQDKEKQIEYLNDSRQSQQSAIALLDKLIKMTAQDEAASEDEPLIISELVDAVWEGVRHKLLQQIKENLPQNFDEMREIINRVPFLNATRRVPPQRMVRLSLTTILEALLQNALEAVVKLDDPRILVRGEITAPDKLELMVTDNGQGMSDNILRHALEPFFSTKGEVGVGLSLSLVNSLVIRQGGSLQIDSKPNHGTTVKIIFPI
ncbi:MAG: ATP-binding protein [Candidatus Adiutrix sp.]